MSMPLSLLPASGKLAEIPNPRPMNATAEHDRLTILLQKTPQELFAELSVIPKEERQQLFASFRVDLQHMEQLTQKIRDALHGRPMSNGAQNLLGLIFSSLPEQDLDSLAAHFYRHLEPVFIYPFLKLLNNANIAAIFLKPILNVRDEDKLRTYRQCIAGIAKEIPMEETSIPPALEVLLEIDPSTLDNSNSWQRSLLIQELNTPVETNSPDAHIFHCILCAAKPELRQKIAALHITHVRALVEWMSGAIRIEPHFERKLQIFRDFITPLNHSQLAVFLNTLKIKHPDVLPFLLCALPDALFDAFIVAEDTPDAIQTNAEILVACRIPSAKTVYSITEKLKQQKRLGPLIDEGLFCQLKDFERNHNTLDDDEPTADAAPIKIYCSFQSIRSDTQKSLLSGELLQEEIYLLREIPEILVVIALLMPTQRHFIMQCLPYWGEEQLKAIGRSMPLELLQKALNQPILNYIAMLLIEAVPKDILCKYCLDQTKKMKLAIREFEAANTQLTIDLERLCRNAATSMAARRQEYEAGSMQVRKLEQSLRQFMPSHSTLMLNHLSQLARDDDENRSAYQEFSQTVLTIRQMHQSCKEAHKDALKTLSRNLDTENETDNDFPNDFLELLTNEISSLLGKPSALNHIEWLARAGITSKHDLKELGYDENKQRILRKMRVLFTDSYRTESNPHSNEGVEIWNWLFYETEDYKKNSRIVTANSRICCPYERKKAETDETFQAASQILESDKLKFRKEMIKALCAIKEIPCTEAILSEDKPLHEIILEALSYYQEEITVRLKCYFSQKNILRAWTALRLKGISSLQAARESGLLNDPASAYELSKLLETSEVTK